MYAELKQQIIEKYEARGKSISEKSVDKYIKDIQKIQSLLDVGEVTDLSFLYNVDAVSSAVEDMRGRKILNGEKVKASTNTKRNYYQSIVSVLDGLDDYTVIKKYQKIVNQYNKLYKVNLEKNNASVTQENEEKLISYKSLKDVDDSSFLGSSLESLDLLIACFISPFKSSTSASIVSVCIPHSSLSSSLSISSKSYCRYFKPSKLSLIS